MAESGTNYGLDNVVNRCWTEDAFKDVTLESNDHVSVPATRVILAARSESLQKLLLEEHPREKIVKIDLEGKVLEAIVEYCYTDSAEILKKMPPTDEGHITTLLTLQAAVSEVMPSMVDTISDCVTAYLYKYPELCFAAYEAWRVETDSSEALGETLLGRVRAIPISSLKPTQIKSLRASTIKQILEDTEMQATEEDLFRLLKMWVDCDPETNKALADGNLLIDCIKLQDISPQVLSTEVANSGLVTPNDMMEAYKNQAMAAANQQPPKFQKKRFSTAPVWSQTLSALSAPEKKSQSWKADVLDIHPITSGKREWTMEYVSVTADEMMFSWLGIMSTATQLDPKKALEYQEGCWAVNDRCRGVNGSETIFADLEEPLEDGSSLTFKLDLTPDQEDRGTLTVTVGSEGIIRSQPLGKFTNLLDHLEKNPGSGFVPAMSIRDDCCVIKISGDPKKLIE